MNERYHVHAKVAHFHRLSAYSRESLVPFLSCFQNQLDSVYAALPMNPFVLLQKTLLLHEFHFFANHELQQQISQSKSQLEPTLTYNVHGGHAVRFELKLVQAEAQAFHKHTFQQMDRYLHMCQLLQKSFQTQFPSAACLKRSRFRFISSYQRASFNPNVVGSA